MSTLPPPRWPRAPGALPSAWGWLLLLQSVALAVLLTFPMALSPLSAAIGSPDSDTAKHLWTLWWMRAEALEGVSGLRTTLIGAPSGVDLFPIEPLHGVFALLLPLPPVALSNLLALVDLSATGVLAGWAASLLVEGARGEPTGLPWRVQPGAAPPLRRLPALVAGLLLQGSSFAAYTLHVGVGELRQLWWLPLCLGLLTRVRAAPDLRGALRAGLWAGLGLAGAALSCFYYGLFAAVMAVAFAGLSLVLGPGPRLRAVVGWAAAAALSLAVVLPTARAFSTTTGEQGARVLAPIDEQGRVSPALARDCANLDELVAPQRGARARADRQRLAYAGGRYLSVFGLGLLILGVAARPRVGLPLLGVAAAGALLSLGPVLHLGQAPVLMGGAPLVLPTAALFSTLAERFAALHFPSRFLALSALGVALLGALAVRRWPKATLLALLCVGNVLWEDLSPYPRSLLRLPDQAGLRALDRPGPMADLSFAALPNVERRGLSIAAQLATGRATQAVPLERLDALLGADTAALRRLPLTQALAARGPAPHTFAAEAEALRAAGFTTLLLTGPDAGPESPARRALTAAWGAPALGEGTALWAIPAE
jgi:hypothetical protein